MVTKNVKASLHGPLRDEVLAEMTVEVSSSIRELFTLYSGSERVNAVIAHVQRYIAEKLGEPVDPNFAGADSYTLETIWRQPARYYRGWFQALYRIHIGSLSSGVTHADSLPPMQLGSW